jgi:hypothetical protein
MHSAEKREKKRHDIWEFVCDNARLGWLPIHFEIFFSWLEIRYARGPARVRRFNRARLFFFGLDNFVLFNCAVSVGLVENNKNKRLLFCIGCLSPVLAHNLLSSLTIDKEKNFVIAVDVAPYFLKRWKSTFLLLFFSFFLLFLRVDRISNRPESTPSCKKKKKKK